MVASRCTPRETTDRSWPLFRILGILYFLRERRRNSLPPPPPEFSRNEWNLSRDEETDRIERQRSTVSTSFRRVSTLFQGPVSKYHSKSYPTRSFAESRIFPRSLQIPRSHYPINFFRVLGKKKKKREKSQRKEISSKITRCMSKSRVFLSPFFFLFVLSLFLSFFSFFFAALLSSFRRCFKPTKWKGEAKMNENFVKFL